MAILFSHGFTAARSFFLRLAVPDALPKLRCALTPRVFLFVRETFACPFMKLKLFAVFALCPLLVLSARGAESVTLETLVQEALDKNPELKFYEAEIVAAKAGRKTAGLLANPEVSGSVGQKTARGGGLEHRRRRVGGVGGATVRVAGTTRTAKGDCEPRH